jgi:dolichyl-phosphate beta-glucosyltransferase
MVPDGLARPFVSVVIPVFRGEGVIRQTIDAIEEHVAKRAWSAEIIVAVSGGGGDRTETVVEQSAADYSNVVVVDTTAHFGKGGAIKEGMAMARGEICCFVDADNGAPFEQIDHALALLDGHNIVVGSRYMSGGDPGKRTLSRTVLSRGGNFLMKVLLGLDYADTRAPLKVFRAPAAKRLFRLSRLRGFGFDTEILFLADRLGYTVCEMPVKWRASGDSAVDVPKDAIKSILELFQIRWYWLRGRYQDA